MCASGVPHFQLKYSPMARQSQWKRLAWKTLRALAALALTAAALVAVAVVLGKVLAKPVARAPVVYVDPERTAKPYLTVAAMGADVEVVAPDGRRASTGASTDSAPPRITEADARVDCSGYGQPNASESACSASVLVPNPEFGEYRVIVSSSTPRGLAVTWGWGGTSFTRSGGGDARVVVEPRAPVSFVLIVAPDGASQKTQPVNEPRATAPPVASPRRRPPVAPR
jgi:hypothetical protein